MSDRTTAAAALRERANAVTVDLFVAEFGDVALVLEPEHRADFSPDSGFFVRTTSVNAVIDNDVERVLLMLRAFVKLDVAFVRRSAAGVDQLVGRNRAAALLLVDPTVSKNHAWLRFGDDGRLTVRDAGSKHGTFVNGDPVTTTPVFLGDGDAVRFGARQIIVLSSRILYAQLRAWKDRPRPTG
jgi:hypothetical protein